MLRYAGCIDEAANLYEVPRPPRRGSHRPEGFQFVRPSATSEMLSSRHRGTAPPPALPRSFAADPSLSRANGVSNPTYSSLLGKQMQHESPSPPVFEMQAVMHHVDSPRAMRQISDLQPPDVTTSQLSFDEWSEGLAAHSQSAWQSMKHDTQLYTHVIDSLDTPFAWKAHERRTAAKTSPASVIEFAPSIYLADNSNNSSTSSNSSRRVRASATSMNKPSSRKGRNDCIRHSPRRSLLENYARTIPLSLSCQSVQKRCVHAGCTKISVSRGLCRGHGGGRRCQMDACTKSAQSRSTFCWAHGGGQRCDAHGCMRSRKSKRYCVAHVALENDSSTLAATLDSSCIKPRAAKKDARPSGSEHVRPTPQQQLPSTLSPFCAPYTPPHCLPSLGQALRAASRSPPNLPYVALHMPYAFSV